ncbi:tripartite tricarboxylate transporter substrate binding protein [Polynucleobacter sp. IMCC30063]|uniref:tripartite tricarboxylate transporter substrate binding protein n=1 Tax=Polynucleobacter sp. IMCC30063 TaxID=2907298 RepID=UPI001F3D2984|nr:tripartite tricarboxylate transporter substrate binding protein [Polynucleobacter sp. IMCC30063]MCE7506548.1 tripartite tricarboxylate transporter substrate binding protein [Polynucleobacter sp. IMCC30063]
MIDKIKSYFLFFFFIASLCFGQYSWAQDKYPSKPIQLIIPWGPSGGSDQTGRLIANQLEQELKISVPVINMPGATGNIGMQKLLSDPADGQTLLLLAWDNFALLATQQPKWKIDDFINLGIVIQLPSGLYVSGDKFNNWKSFEQAAKNSPVSIAISGLGSTDDITMSYLQSKGLKINVIPYAKPGERYAALIGGHVDALYSPAGNVASFVESKQMRPIIFFSAERLNDFKDIPTSKEVGYNVTLPQRRALIIKAGTDPAKIAVISQALNKIVNLPKYKAYLKDSFASEKSYVPQSDTLVVMNQDLEEMQKILKNINK